MDAITITTKAELLKLATEIVLANSEDKSGGIMYTAKRLGLPEKPHDNFLDILDQVYAHLLAKINE